MSSNTMTIRTHSNCMNMNVQVVPKQTPGEVEQSAESSDDLWDLCITTSMYGYSHTITFTEPYTVPMATWLALMDGEGTVRFSRGDFIMRVGADYVIGNSGSVVSDVHIPAAYLNKGLLEVLFKACDAGFKFGQKI